MSDKLLRHRLAFCEVSQGSYNSERIWQFEQVLRAFVQDNSLRMVPLFEEVQVKIQAGEPFFTDGLHPNDQGHEWMYQKIREQLSR